jgi:ABC-2 type transport system permease protein
MRDPLALAAAAAGCCRRSRSGCRAGCGRRTLRRWPGSVGQLLFIPLLLFSGFYLPRASMPPALRNIGDWTPTGAAAHALQDAMFGSFPSAQSLLVLTAWAVAFGILAVRFFRWE